MSLTKWHEGHRVTLLENGAQRPGPALGVFDGSTYAVAETVLTPGDLVVLFTDGLYEVESPDGELYDQSRLLQAIRTRASLPTERIFDETMAEVRGFSGKETFADDVCLVGAEINPLAADETNA